MDKSHLDFIGALSLVWVKIRSNMDFIGVIGRYVRSLGLALFLSSIVKPVMRTSRQPGGSELEAYWMDCSELSLIIIYSLSMHLWITHSTDAICTTYSCTYTHGKQHVSQHLKTT